MRLWRVIWTRRAERGYHYLTPARKQMVLELLEDLKADPYPPEAEPLKSSRELAGNYKVKIDGWRVIYRPKSDDRVIVILAVEPRSSKTYLNL